MMVASKHDGKIPSNEDYVKRVAYLSKKPNFQKLLDVGFIELIDGCNHSVSNASTLQANDTTEKRREETEGKCEFNKDAKFVLDYFNNKTGKRARVITDELMARLKNKELTTEECCKIIDCKTKEWLGGNMEKHLNLTTLFKVSNYDKYRIQAESEETNTQRPALEQMMAGKNGVIL
jgi:uncharacterized phage protein (TIGR02220 family)